MLIMILLEFWMTWSAFTLGYAAAKAFVEMPSFFENHSVLKKLLSPQRIPLLKPGGIEAVPAVSSSVTTTNDPGALESDIRDTTISRTSISRRRTRTSIVSPDQENEDVTFHALTSRISVWREDGVYFLLSLIGVLCLKRNLIISVHSCCIFPPLFRC
jgi:hypothetical protein